MKSNTHDILVNAFKELTVLQSEENARKRVKRFFKNDVNADEWYDRHCKMTRSEKLVFLMNLL